MGSKSKTGSDENSNPLSYWNTPAILRSCNLENDEMPELNKYSRDKVTTPRVQNMYHSYVNAKSQAGKKPTGEFVDWGTKLYQLELELSYKDNEIAILKKKIKKISAELYPDGDMGKMSLVTSLQDKCLIAERKLHNKQQELKIEKNKSKGLSFELSKVKKQNTVLRRQKLNNDKAIQTVPDNNKSIQVKPRSAPKSRNATTQCVPVRVKTQQTSVGPDHFQQITTETFDDVETRFQEKQIVRTNYQQPTSRTTSSSGVSTLDEQVQFATALNIKETEQSTKLGYPLEMSVTQEFSDGNVKTVVHSNKNFEINEEPLLAMSPTQQPVNHARFLTPTPPSHSQVHLHTNEIQHISHSSPKPSSGLNKSTDSGIFSEHTSPQASPNNTFQHRPKPSYSQILNGSRSIPATTSSKTTYEKYLPLYMKGSYVSKTPPISSQYNTSNPLRSYTAPRWQDEYRSSLQQTGSGLIPYYLFRREQGSENVRKSDTPIYVHTSEISFT